MSSFIVDSLSVWYEEQIALREFCIEVEQGQSAALIGPSGSGKSTALKGIGAVLPHFARCEVTSIRLDERELSNLPTEKRDCPMVFSDFKLFKMTVEQNIAFGLPYRGVHGEEAVRRTHDVLDRVGLYNLRHRPFCDLSDGERQRTAIARAIVLRPRILLLDEFSANLDGPLRAQMIDAIRELQRSAGTIVVFASHDQRQVLEWADRVYVLRKGRVVQEGPPDEVYWWPVDPVVGNALGPMNHIPGELAVMPEGGYLFRLGNGTDATLHLDRLRIVNGSAGSRVLLGVRPWAVRLVPAESVGGHNALMAQVTERRSEGEFLVYELQVAGAVSKWIASFPGPPGGRTHYEVGDRVGVVVDGEFAVVYPFEGEGQ